MEPSVLKIDSNSRENAMVLSCPRCGTDVPSEALYCPYCSLPKPKAGFTETPENAEPVAAAPAEQPQAPRSSIYSQKLSTSKKRPARTATPQPVKAQPITSQPTTRQFLRKPEKPERKYRISVLSIAALVAVLAVGIYIFVVPMVYSEQAEPKVVLAALDKLRHLPSADPTMTVDARCLKELETSKRVGNLVSYQGWGVRPVKGSRHKVLFVYSFQEVGNVQQSAEWLADLNSNTFEPQNELAKTISVRKPAE
jgi:hypothetical protein